MTHNAMVIPMVVRARAAGSVDSALEHFGGVGGKRGSGGAPGATGSVSNVRDVVDVKLQARRAHVAMALIDRRAIGNELGSPRACRGHQD
jgi:hypothetical protein